MSWVVLMLIFDFYVVVDTIDVYREIKNQGFSKDISYTMMGYRKK